MHRTYEIAGGHLRVCGSAWTAVMDRLDGFAPFLQTTDAAAPDCELHDGTHEPLPEWETILYRLTDNGMTTAFGRVRGGYRQDIADADGELHLWMEADTGRGWLKGSGSPSLLRLVLWTAYGAAMARKGVLAIHSSCLVYDGKAVMCLGESGTGKSTHTRLWRTHIPGTTLLNDDSPFVRIGEDGAVSVYGSPWSGKTPCYKAEQRPLAACIRLSQAPENAIRRLPAVQAYAALHPSAAPAFAYDDRLYDAVSQVLGRMVEAVPVYHLRCLPNEEAALLARATIFRNPHK